MLQGRLALSLHLSLFLLHHHYHQHHHPLPFFLSFTFSLFAIDFLSELSFALYPFHFEAPIAMFPSSFHLRLFKFERHSISTPNRSSSDLATYKFLPCCSSFFCTSRLLQHQTRTTHNPRSPLIPLTFLFKLKQR